MKLQKDFLVISSNKKIFHRLTITEEQVLDEVNADIFFDVIYERKICTVIQQKYYDEMISRMCSIIYGKFADPETPIYDLVNSFKYIHNVFLNEPCKD